jgi:amino acid permease
MFYVVVLVVADFFITSPKLTIKAVNFDVISGMSAFSIIVMAFASQMTALSVYSDLRNPTPARMKKLILMSSFFSFTAYLLCGLFGYLLFGSAVQSNILKNSDKTSYIVGKLLVAFSMALGIPLLMFPTRECSQWIIEHVLCRSARFNSFWSRHERHHFNILTASIILLAVPLSYLFEDLDQLLGLFGAFCGSTIVFIFPALFFLKVQNELDMKKWERVSSFVVLGIGVFLLGVGGVTSILNLVRKK